jgi:hypothetical protein
VPGYDASHRDDEHPDDLDELDRALDHIQHALGLLDPIDAHLDGTEQHLLRAVEHLERARAGRVPGGRAAGTGGDVQLPDAASPAVRDHGTFVIDIPDESRRR